MVARGLFPFIRSLCGIHRSAHQFTGFGKLTTICGGVRFKVQYFVLEARRPHQLGGNVLHSPAIVLKEIHFIKGYLKGRPVEMIRARLPGRGLRLIQAVEKPVRKDQVVIPKLEEIISKALEKDRKLRYQSAAEMRTDLQRVKRDSESGRSLAASPRAASVSRFSRWMVLAPILLVASGGAYFLLHQRAPKLTEKDTLVLTEVPRLSASPGPASGSESHRG